LIEPIVCSPAHGAFHRVARDHGGVRTGWGLPWAGGLGYRRSCVLLVRAAHPMSSSFIDAGGERGWIGL